MDVVSFGILVFILHTVNGKDCTFHKPCSCSTDDYKIDLSPMMKHNKKPLTVNYLGAVYYLDPCGRPLDVDVCRRMLGPTATGCQQEGNFAYGIAKTSDYTASGDPEAGTVTFKYSYGVGSQKRTTRMKVVCSDDERRLTCEGEHPVMTYNFVLYTKYACKHVPSPSGGGGSGGGGLSTGSVLVIIFFVLLIVYIIGGVLFLKYYRKEEGVANLIPNREFWVEIPLLVKDGFVFVVAKVRGDSTYERI